MQLMRFYMNAEKPEFNLGFVYAKTKKRILPK